VGRFDRDRAGDPLAAATKAQTAAIAPLRTQQKKDLADLALRFNWNAPLSSQPHNPAVIYFAGNVRSSRPSAVKISTSSRPDLSGRLEAKIDIVGAFDGWRDDRRGRARNVWDGGC
jgi:hypothetical protein